MEDRDRKQDQDEDVQGHVILHTKRHDDGAQDEHGRTVGRREDDGEDDVQAHRYM